MTNKHTEVEETQRKFIRWFSSLTSEQMSQGGNNARRVLSEMKSYKTRVGDSCFWSPCQNREYSRGLCKRHYSLISNLKRITNEPYQTFVDIGICKRSTHDKTVLQTNQD